MEKLRKDKLLKWLKKERKEAIKEHEPWISYVSEDKDGIGKCSEVEYCHVAYAYQKVIERIVDGQFNEKIGQSAKEKYYKEGAVVLE